VDPLGDIAYGPLAQLYLSQNKIQKAVETYDKAIKVARTEQELVTAISCREAALAQIRMSERYPDLLKKFMNQ
jgi:import receptor subunit TOM70